MSKPSIRKSINPDVSQAPSDSSVQLKDKKQPMVSCHCPPSNLVGGQTIGAKGEKKKVKKLSKYDCKTVDITPFFIYLLTLHLNQAENQELASDGSLKNCCQTSNFLLKKIIDKVAVVAQKPMGACGNCFNKDCGHQNNSATCCECNKPKNDNKSCVCNDVPTHENCFKEFDQKYGDFYNKLLGFLEAVKANDDNFQPQEPDFLPQIKSQSSCHCRNKLRGRGARGAGEFNIEKCLSKQSNRRAKFAERRYDNEQFRDSCLAKICQSATDYENPDSAPITNEDELRKIIDRIIRDSGNEDKIKDKLPQNDSIENVESSEIPKETENKESPKEPPNTNEALESIIEREIKKYFKKYGEEMHKSDCPCNPKNDSASKPFEIKNICPDTSQNRQVENPCKYQNDHPPPILGNCLKCGCKTPPGKQQKTCIPRVSSDVFFFLQEEGAPTKKISSPKKTIKPEKKEKPKIQQQTKMPQTIPKDICEDNDIRICHEKHKDISMSGANYKSKEKVCTCDPPLKEPNQPKMRKINNMTCYFDEISRAPECPKINRGTSPICVSDICQDKIEQTCQSSLKTVFNRSQNTSLESNIVFKKKIIECPEKVEILEEKYEAPPKDPEKIIEINEAPKKTNLPYTKTENPKFQKQIIFKDPSPIQWEPMVVKEDCHKEIQSRCKVSQIKPENLSDDSDICMKSKCKPVELTHSYHQGVHKFTCVEPKVMKTCEDPCRTYNKGTQLSNEEIEFINLVKPYRPCRTYNKSTQPINEEPKKGNVCKDTSMKYTVPKYEDNQMSNQKSKAVCKDTSMKYTEPKYEDNQMSNQKSKAVCKDTSMKYTEPKYEDNQMPNQKSKVVCKDREGNIYDYEQNYNKQQGDLSEEYSEETDNEFVEEETWSEPDTKYKGGNFYVQNKRHIKSVSLLNKNIQQKKLLEEQALQEMQTSFRAQKYKKPVNPPNLKPLVPPKNSPKRTIQNQNSDNLYIDPKKEELDEIRSKYYKRHAKCFQNADYSKNKLGLGTINIDQSENEQSHSDGESYPRKANNLFTHKKPVYFSYENKVQMKQKHKWTPVDDVISGHDVEVEPNLTPYDGTDDADMLAANYGPGNYNKKSPEMRLDKNYFNSQERSQERSQNRSQDRSPQKYRPKLIKTSDPRVQTSRQTDKRINPVFIEWSNEFLQEEQDIENNLSYIKSAEIEESTSSSEKLSVLNRTLSPIPEAECENSSGSNSIKNEAPREIKAVKRFFNFSRKKEEPSLSEQQSKRKTIKEFLLGIKKDIARKKSLAQKQEDNDS